MVKILSDVSLSTSTDDLTVGGTIELGHATDTTLSRSAAGVLAVEGVTVALTNQIPPTGSIVMWPTAAAPVNWLFLDGATYSQSTYPDLAAVFGVVSGTFTLPDMRDRFAAGASTIAALSNNAGTFAPNTANATAHDHTTNIAHGHLDNFSIPNHATHTHSVNPPSTESNGSTLSNGRGNSGTIVAVAANGHTHDTDIASFTSGTGSTTQTHAISGSVTALGTTNVTSTTGGATLLPKSTLLNFIIKT